MARAGSSFPFGHYDQHNPRQDPGPHLAHEHGGPQDPPGNQG